MIVAEVQRRFGLDHILTIALCGGWGRDESTIISDGKKIDVTSDYDILVVTSSPITDARAVDLRRDLSRIVGTPTEIGFWTTNDLKQLPPSISTYELSKHKVLWGNARTLSDSLPIIHPDTLPLFEGSWLLFNRGSALLAAILDFIRGSELRQSQTALIRATVKMALALGDAWLLIDGEYVYSGLERYRRISNSMQVIPEVKVWYEWAWETKRGQRPVNTESAWNLTRTFMDICSGSHLEFERRRLHSNPLDWHAYAASGLHIDIHKPYTYLRIFLTNVNLFGYSRGHCWPFSKAHLVTLQRRMMAILPLLLYSWCNNVSKDGSDLAMRLLNIDPESRSLALEKSLPIASAKYAWIWSEYFG